MDHLPCQYGFALYDIRIDIPQLLGFERCYYQILSLIVIDVYES